MNNNTTIHISSGTMFRVVLIGLLFVALYFLRDLALVLLASVVIASAVEPATRWFSRYKIPRVLGVLFVYITVAIVLGAIFYLFIPALFAETANLGNLLADRIGSLDITTTSKEVFTGADAGTLVNDLSKAFPLQDAIKGFETFARSLSGNAFHAISVVFGGVLSFLLIIIISFYLAVQEDGIVNFLRIVTPERHEDYVINLWRRSQQKIGKWAQGQVILGLLIGVLVYLGLTVLGVKYALTLALLAAVFELIPIFGPILAAVPAVLFGFSEGATLGLMVIGFYIIIQQFENHLIYPLVVRKVVGVPPLLVIISLIIGAELAGFLGILLSVPIAAALMEYADDVQKKKGGGAV
ncbi:MAG: AI-2E family transporter [Patescibacteria group bacterium]